MYSTAHSSHNLANDGWMKLWVDLESTSTLTICCPHFPCTLMVCGLMVSVRAWSDISGVSSPHIVPSSSSLTGSCPSSQFSSSTSIFKSCALLHLCPGLYASSHLKQRFLSLFSWISDVVNLLKLGLGLLLLYSWIECLVVVGCRALVLWGEAGFVCESLRGWS